MTETTERRDKFAAIRLSIPTPEEMLASRKRRIEAARHNPTCFTHWFPAVERLGIPHPRSLVIDFPYDLTGAVIDESFEESHGPLVEIVARIRDFGEQVGYPLFMKNSLFSGKHNWPTTCFIAEDASDEDIMAQICNLTHFWAMVGAEFSLYLVVREFIDTDPVFHAFGGMPVTAEFRLFANDGDLVGWQPYWPEEAIRDPSVENWRERLTTIAEPREEEMAQMREWAGAVTRELGGYWSVDFLRDKYGKLWLIDMAEGNKSYRCPVGYRDV